MKPPAGRVRGRNAIVSVRSRGRHVSARVVPRFPRQFSALPCVTSHHSKPKISSTPSPTRSPTLPGRLLFPKGRAVGDVVSHPAFGSLRLCRQSQCKRRCIVPAHSWSCCGRVVSETHHSLLSPKHRVLSPGYCIFALLQNLLQKVHTTYRTLPRNSHSRQ